MTSIKPTVTLKRGGTQGWVPTWTTSSPSAPDISSFLTNIRVKDAGNYGLTTVDLTLKNTTGNIVGVFTNASFETVILPKEYFNLHVDDGNVSRYFFGYFGSWDSEYKDRPPNTVTFRGVDQRIEEEWRTISVDFNTSANPTNASDA